MARAKSICSSLIIGTAIAALFAGSLASAQQAGDSAVNFTDPSASLSGPSAPALQFSADDGLRPRFNHAVGPVMESGPEPQRLQLELAAGGAHAPVDVSISQRASLGANANGDVDQRGSGSELRIGRGLVNERNSSDGASTYVFVASDNEALTWQPGTRSEFGGRGGSLAVQDQVEIGDLAAGVTYENNGVQASVAYVERSESTRVGNQTYNQDQSFTGVTVTMRR